MVVDDGSERSAATHSREEEGRGGGDDGREDETERVEDLLQIMWQACFLTRAARS